MADRSALGWMGALLGMAATAVVMIGAVVVTDHLTGRLQFDSDLRVVSLPQSAR